MDNLAEDDRSFFDYQQQQEEQRHKELEHLKDLLWLRETLKWPDAIERTLVTAEKLGLEKEFNQYLKEINHGKH